MAEPCATTADRVRSRLAQDTSLNATPSRMALSTTGQNLKMLRKTGIAYFVVADTAVGAT
jgi:hypothetical protein